MVSRSKYLHHFFGHGRSTIIIPKMKALNYLLIISLLIVAAIMIYLGTKGGILPPTLTGVGFIIIAAIFFVKDKK